MIDEKLIRLMAQELITSHKAGDDPDSRDQRDFEATALRANLDALGDGIHAILAGDFNTYTSEEPMYQTLLADGPGEAFDPIDELGDWHDDETFRAIHTQAPSVEFGSGGGMDDRFDFQLMTGELLDTEGLDYIPGSYRAFGNNGTHPLKGNIAKGSGASPAVLAALTTASDHLPVIADYQVPAILDVLVDAVPPTLNLGRPFSLEVTVRNAADVQVSWGADELDYVLTTSGSLFGPDRGMALALSEGNTHQIELNTSIVGVRSGTITVSSDGQGIAGGVVEIPVAYEVVVRLPGDYSANGVVDQADLDLVLTSWGKPYDELPGTWVGDVPTEGIIAQAELDRALTSWGRTGGAHTLGAQPAKGVPEPATVTLLLCGFVVFSRMRSTTKGPSRIIRGSVVFDCLES